MANVAKYDRSACGHLCKHYERARGEDGEFIKFGNQNIDTTRSHLNYNLAPDRPEGQYTFIKQRTGEVRCMSRADVKVMCTWVVTAPKGLDEQDHERFFKTAYGALAEKYGEKNVVSAWVHQDETQPHLHFAFVPVTRDKKKGDEKVSAKEVLTRAELRDFHPWLSDVMRQEFGRDIGIETGELGTRGNLTMEQYKVVQAANQAAEEARQDVAAVQEQLEQLRGELPEAERTGEAVAAIGDVVDQTEKAVTRLGRYSEAKERIMEFLEPIRRPFSDRIVAYKITPERLEKLCSQISAAISLTEQKFVLGRFGSEPSHFEPSALRKMVEDAQSALVAAYQTVNGRIARELERRLQRTEWERDQMRDEAATWHRRCDDRSEELARARAIMKNARLPDGRNALDALDHPQTQAPARNTRHRRQHDQDLEL